MSELMRRNILVTGSHRSGTTWTGQMLAKAPGTGYTFEPFNIDPLLLRVDKPFTEWFQYVCEENANQYREYLRNTVAFKYPFLRGLAQVRTFKYGARTLRHQARCLRHRVRNDTAIVKDP